MYFITMKYYIYKISDNKNEEEFYIGSTIDFKRRQRSHKKSVCNRVKKIYWCRLYQYIRANGGWSNFTMSIIHEADSGVSKQESDKLIKQVEQQYIEQLKPTLNSVKASINV